MAVRIGQAESAEQIGAIRELFLEYAASLPFSLCFQGFDNEVATLPGKYAPPQGRLYLALVHDRAAGCIALREVAPAPGEEPRVCEMKRLFVRPAFRGLGLGRQLTERLISEARAIGYRVMKLDSEPDFTAAVALYRSLGFVDIPRYNDDPHPHTLFLGLTL